MSALVTRQRASKILGVSHTQVENMIRDGRLIPTNYLDDNVPVFSMDYLLRVRDTIVVQNTGRRRTRKAPAATA